MVTQKYLDDLTYEVVGAAIEVNTSVRYPKAKSYVSMWLKKYAESK